MPPQRHARLSTMHNYTVTMDTKRAELFYELFGVRAQVEACATARVNLLGEHTDYNHGLVLPTQLPQRLHVLMAAAEGAAAGGLRIASVAHDAQRGHASTPVFSRRLAEGRQGHWSDYGVAALAEAAASMDGALPSLCVLIDSDIPMGAGLSSSAALEVALLRAVRSMMQGAHAESLWDDYELARMAQRAENDYVGMPCGLMDQLVLSLGTMGSALFIDFYDERAAVWRGVPLFAPDAAVFSVHYSGLSHELAHGSEDGYERRRNECERAAAALGVEHLSACSIDELVRHEEGMDGVLVRRARHVITENERVKLGVQALERDDVVSFGDCMNKSHESQRDDFEVSLPQLDAMVACACACGAYGARLTGGGFGGSIVVLSKPSDVPRISAEIQNCVGSARCLAVLEHGL